MSHRTKVIYIIWSLDQGGAEQVVINLANGLDRARFEASVCCLNEEGRYAFKVRAAGIKVTALHKKRRLDPGFLFRLIGFLKKEKPDLVHTHLFTSNLWGRIAALVARVPVVCTEHNVDLWKKKFHFWIDAVLAPFCLKVICVSKKVEKFYRSMIVQLQDKTTVIYNGIDVFRYQPGKDGVKMRRELGIKNGKYCAGMVGRLVPQKRQLDFIEAVTEMNRLKCELNALIIGDGPEKANLEKAVTSRHMSERIILAGFRDEMPEIYNAMDFFVLCSEREGFPMTVLEAMASGVPVIATDVGGVAECIRHEKNGLLISVGEPDEIRRAIKQLMDDSNFRKRMIQNALECVRSDFSMVHMIREHEELYWELLNNRKSEAVADGNHRFPRRSTRTRVRV